ncbi:UNVERIFIED_CONTAM: hypothetical protein NCL1_39977 [Trichonephila clavipes]
MQKIDSRLKSILLLLGRSRDSIFSPRSTFVIDATENETENDAIALRCILIGEHICLQDCSIQWRTQISHMEEGYKILKHVDLSVKGLISMVKIKNLLVYERNEHPNPLLVCATGSIH